MPILRVMDWTGQLIQFGGSLLAILALAGLAAWMKLGGSPRLSTEAEVREAAQEVEDGFDVSRFAISRDQRAALARGADGRILLLKLHGNRFAGRILTSQSFAITQRETLIVNSGEKRYGCVELRLDDPDDWASAINEAKHKSDA